MTVEAVHDGDTLRARVVLPNDVVTDQESTRVRLIGVDTPEVSPDLECWGDDAATRLRELIPAASTVWVVPDFTIDGFWTYVGAVIVMWLVNVAVGRLLRQIQGDQPAVY